MKTWKIPVVWEEMGIVKVVANTLEEAMELARDTEGVIPLPDDSSYVDGSWNLASSDEKYIRSRYNHGQRDEKEEK